MSSGLVWAGVARSVITPPLGTQHGTWRLRTGWATGVHDEMSVTALWLSSEDGAVALVGVDTLAIDESTYQLVLDGLVSVTDLDGVEVVVNAAHNHTAPLWPLESVDPSTAIGRWTRALVDQIVGVVWAARHRAQPALLGTTRTSIDGLTVNRVWPERDLANSIHVIGVDRPDGSPLATVFAFACHGVTVGGHTLEWSADFPGPARATIERRLPGSTAIFLQGACGDVSPLDFWFGNDAPRPMGFDSMRTVGEGLAARVIEIRRSIRPSASAAVLGRHETVQLPRRRLAWSESAIVDLLSLEPDKATLQERWPPEVHMCTSAQLNPSYYRHMALSTLARISQLEETPYSVQIQSLRVADLAVVTTPFELFSDLAVQIDKASPALTTLTLGYTNGYESYFPPDGALAPLEDLSLTDYVDQARMRWAYGITNTRCADGAGQVLVGAAVWGISSLFDV